MRRLSAFLMIAALVAALVPSTALAGKPVPSITNIDVVSLAEVDEICQVEVQVWFTGRAFDVWVGVIQDAFGVGADAPLADNKAGCAIAYFPAPLLGSSDYKWEAVLRDRKGKEISPLSATGTDSFTASGGPGYGTVVATFPY